MVIERKLISSNQFSYRLVYPIFTSFMLGLAVIGIVTRNDVYYTSLVIFAVVIVLFFRFRNRVHPVYFDDNYLIWVKAQIEQKIAFTDIKKIVVMGFKGGYDAKVEYHDHINRLQSLYFYLPSAFSGNPNTREDLVAQLEHLIQKQQPDFKITLPSYWVGVLK